MSFVNHKELRIGTVGLNCAKSNFKNYCQPGHSFAIAQSANSFNFYDKLRDLLLLVLQVPPTGFCFQLRTARALVTKNFFLESYH